MGFYGLNLSLLQTCQITARVNFVNKSNKNERTMKVQIADNSNLVTLVDKIYPVRCVFEDLVI